MKSRTLPRLFVVVALLIAVLAWVLSIYDAISKLERQLDATPPASGAAGGALSEQRQQIQSFETRLARVLGASVESKLRTLEKSVERGPLNADELRLIESTATELRLLQSNPAALAAGAADLTDHPRYQAAAANQPAPETTDLLREITELRKVYYASLIGFALFGLMACGLWFNARRRQRQIEATTRHQLPVIKSYLEDRGR